MVKTGRIPKIIHYCWFGGSPIPEETKKYIETWSEKCPDYEIKQWDESNFDINKYTYAREAFRAKKWAFVSDVCRCEKLYEYGGIYLDVNTEILQNLDRFLDNDMFVGFEQDSYPAFSLFGSLPNNKIIGEVLERYKNESLYLSNGEINFSTINNRFEPYLTKLGMKRDNSLQKLHGVTVYPKEFFQPAYWNSSIIDNFTQNTYSVHYFGASWHDKETRSRLRFLRNYSPLISIIIPIYNVEKYLTQCIGSVTSQTYKNLEIICVDDKTTDKSGRIADDFAKKDSRIKVIHKKKNEGLNMARKTGFENSHGDYITFIDGDDAVDKNYVKNLFESIVRNNVDIAIAGFKKFVKNPEIAQFLLEKTEEPIEKISRDRNELLRYCIGRENFGFNNICQPVAWGRLFRREIISQTDWKFANYQTNEDEFESIQWFNIAKSIAVKNEVLYYYRTNPDSKTSVKYQNRDLNNEHGLEINQFEFAKILYDKTAEYLKNPAIEEDNLWRFRLENRVFLRRRVRKNTPLDQSEMQSLSDNLTMIAEKIDEKIQYKNYEIDRKNLTIVRQDAELASFLSTKRSAKLLAGNIRRMVARNTEDLIARRRGRFIDGVRKRNKNNYPSIISRNCIGGAVYHDLGMRFYSPTINLWMQQKDFNLYIKHIRDFSKNGRLVRVGTQEQYPVGDLECNVGKIRIYFQHYKNFNEAKRKWIERSSRINFDNIFLVDELRDEWSLDDIRDFNKLPYPKVLFNSNKKLNSRINIYEFHINSKKPFYGGQILEYPNKFSIKRWYQEFNWAKFLTNATQKDNSPSTNH